MGMAYVYDYNLHPEIIRLHDAIKSKTWCVVDDITLTYDTCRCVVGIFDAMKPANKSKFLTYDIEKQIKIAFRLYYMVRSKA